VTVPRRRNLIAVLLVLAGLAYLATGLHVVAPGEAAVVRRLGRALPHPWGPGLHLGLPAGLDHVTPVRIDEVRRQTVGLAGAPGRDDEPGAGEFLTGDLNLLRAEATVQYRVADPVAFTLHARDVEALVRRSAEAGLNRALSRLGVDACLGEGRAEVVRDVESALVGASDRYGLGVAILGVSLTDVRPPSEVAADFAAAQSARSDHDRRINEARTRAATTLTRARAEAGARAERARAVADRTLALARGRAGRFLALLTEAGKTRGLTVRRLYLDALRDLLPRVRRKLVLTPDEPIDLSILGGRQ
jgi:membrane protease subunit HflK